MLRKLDDPTVDFKRWYTDENIKKLVYSPEKKTRCLRYVFSYSGDDCDPYKTFLNQFRQIVTLKDKLRAPVYFISMRPGTALSSHFIFGIVVDNRLMIMNPLGDENKPDFYKVIFKIKTLKLIDSVWISRTVIQKDKEGLVSCGPICVELFNHFSSLSKGIIFKENVLSKNLEFSEEELETFALTAAEVKLTYNSIEISTGLPESLKPLLGSVPLQYQAKLEAIRQNHKVFKLKNRESLEQKLVFEMLSGGLQDVAEKKLFLELRTELDTKNTTLNLGNAILDAFNNLLNANPLKTSQVTLNVSGDRNNCGLFALILGIKIAQRNASGYEALTNCHVLSEVDENSLQGTTTKTREVGNKLREKMYEALSQDQDIYKKRRYESFLALCGQFIEKEEGSIDSEEEKKNKEDMKAFIHSNQPYIDSFVKREREIKQAFEEIFEDSEKEYCEYLDQNVTQMSLIKSLRKQLLKLVSPKPDQKKIHELINTYYRGEQNNVNRLIKQRRLFRTAWLRVTGLKEEGEYRNLLSDKINEIFNEKILNILKFDKKDLNRNLLHFSLLEKTNFNEEGFLDNISAREEVLSTAISFFIQIDLLEKWEEIYQSYCIHIRDSTEMLTADELGCLASYLNVQLTVQFKNRNPYESYQKYNPRLLNVTLCNPSEIHWMVVCEGASISLDNSKKIMELIRKIKHGEYIENIVNAINNQAAYECRTRDCSYLVGVFSAVKDIDEFKRQGKPLSDADSKLAVQLSSLLFPENQAVKSNIELIYRLAPELKEILRSRKKLREPIEQKKNIVFRKEANLGDEFEREKTLLKENSLDETSGKHNKVTQLDPENNESLRDKGERLRKEKNLYEAQTCLDDALSVNPDDALTWQYKGRVNRDLGHYTQALENFETAKKKEPSLAFSIEQDIKETKKLLTETNILQSQPSVSRSKGASKRNKQKPTYGESVKIAVNFSDYEVNEFLKDYQKKTDEILKVLVKIKELKLVDEDYQEIEKITLDNNLKEIPDLVTFFKERCSLTLKDCAPSQLERERVKNEQAMLIVKVKNKQHYNMCFLSEGAYEECDLYHGRNESRGHIISAINHLMSDSNFPSFVPAEKIKSLLGENDLIFERRTRSQAPLKRQLHPVAKGEKGLFSIFFDKNEKLWKKLQKLIKKMSNTIMRKIKITNLIKKRMESFVFFIENDPSIANNVVLNNFIKNLNKCLDECTDPYKIRDEFLKIFQNIERLNISPLRHYLIERMILEFKEQKSQRDELLIKLLEKEFNQDSLNENARSSKQFKDYSSESEFSASDCSDVDDINGGEDLLEMPTMLEFRRSEGLVYQHALSVDSGVYKGTVNKDMQRNGFGTFSKGADHMQSMWANDKVNNPLYSYVHHDASTRTGIYFNGQMSGQTDEVLLTKGHGKIINNIDNIDCIYKGRIKNNKPHGYGVLSIILNEQKRFKIVAKWEKGKIRFDNIYKNEIYDFFNRNRREFFEQFKRLILSDQRILIPEIILKTLDDDESKFLSDISKEEELSDTIKVLADNLHAVHVVIEPLHKEYFVDQMALNIKYQFDILVLIIENLKRNMYQKLYINQEDKVSGELKNIIIEGVKVITNKVKGNQNSHLVNDIGNAKEEIHRMLRVQPEIIDFFNQVISIAKLAAENINSEERGKFIDFCKEYISSLWGKYFQFVAHQDNVVIKNKDFKIVAQNCDFLLDCFRSFVEIDLEIRKNKQSISLKKDTLIKSREILLKLVLGFMNAIEPWAHPSVNFNFVQKHGISNGSKIEDIRSKLIDLLYESVRETELFPLLQANEYQKEYQEILDYRKSNREYDGIVKVTVLFSCKDLLKTLDYFSTISNFGCRNRIEKLLLSDYKGIIQSQLGVLIKLIEYGKAIADAVSVFREYIEYYSDLCSTFDKYFGNTARINDGIECIKYLNNLFNQICVLVKAGVIKEPNILITELQKIENFIVNLNGCELGLFVEIDKVATTYGVEYVEFIKKLFKNEGDQKTRLEIVRSAFEANGSNLKYLSKEFLENIVKNGIVTEDVRSILIEEIQVLQNSVPIHYGLSVVKKLLEIIIRFNLMNTNQIDNLKAKGYLLESVGRLLVYFKEQYKYASLKRFEDDFLNSFRSIAVKDIKELSNYLVSLEQYFQYAKKLNEIDVEKALSMLEKKNDSLTKEKIGALRECFDLYEEKFNEYYKEYNDLHSLTQVVKDTKRTAELFLKKSNNEDISFIRKNVSYILAGLSIVLSVNASEILSKVGGDTKGGDLKNGYFLQPHCIQILGIFKLLGLDSLENMPSENMSSNCIIDAFLEKTPNHLGEVLTGQGKSWILSLLAGFFALLERSVTVACYSDYLSTRDAEEFKRYLKQFNFLSQVRHLTFDKICNEKLTIKTINGDKNLRGIIDEILTKDNLAFSKVEQKNDTKSVLLIDEVDVLFSDKIMQKYSACVNVTNPFFAKLQKIIYQAVVNEKSDTDIKQLIIEEATRHIDSGDKTIERLWKGGISQGFFSSHIERMISTARNVFTQKNLWETVKKEKFRINDAGYIEMYEAGVGFVSYYFSGYYNAFYYLKFIMEKYNTLEEAAHEGKNYGYINVDAGTVAYGKLPGYYDNIFGVTGSLHLSTGEDLILQQYKIKKESRSYFPSFFGYSKLVFNIKTDCYIMKTDDLWAQEIVSHANSKIKEKRSILIFFEDTTKLILFKEKFAANFGTTVLYATENEISNPETRKTEVYEHEQFNKLISDSYSGHHGYVTLLTKTFGRGVDFKTEAFVLKQGGAHVIQTFFSRDMKEQIQIQGRTARKDAPGSCELILNAQDLMQQPFQLSESTLDSTDFQQQAYERLSKVREELNDKHFKYAQLEIQKNSEITEKTMVFLRRAVFECNNHNRQEFIAEIQKLGQ